MISIVDASELEHVLRPTVYRPTKQESLDARRPTLDEGQSIEVRRNADETKYRDSSAFRLASDDCPSSSV